MNCINKTGGSEPLGSNETNCINKTGGSEPLRAMRRIASIKLVVENLWGAMR